MMTTSTNALLFVGLGNMGRPMAMNYAANRDQHLCDQMFVYDTNAEVAAEVAAATKSTALPDLESVPDNIRTVILMLPNSRIVESVLRSGSGLFERLATGSLVIDMSSSEPASTEALASLASELGIEYVDAPVSGGVAKAETGKLAIMMGGDDTAVERAQRHLRSIGESITHVGSHGTGHTAKSLNNLLAATNLGAAAEILTVAAKAGINPEKMLQVINGSTGRSQASEFKYPRYILNGRFDSGFSMDLMLKDLMIARNLIVQRCAEAPIVLAAQETAEKARKALESVHPDHTEFARYYESRNETPLRAN